MLKKKLTYASLELLVVIARAEKASGRVDWARLVFSNLKTGVECDQSGTGSE